MKAKIQYYLIDCSIDSYDVVLELCRILKKNGHFFSVNMTKNNNHLNVNRVTKEEFNEQTFF